MIKRVLIGSVLQREWIGCFLATVVCCNAFTTKSGGL